MHQLYCNKTGKIYCMLKEQVFIGISLVLQWLEFDAFNADAFNTSFNLW